MEEQYIYIDSDSQLQEYCQSIANTKTLCFDTEFISERTYWPQLCLVQVATDQGLAIIDPLTIKDMNPFWQLLVEGSRETIVHAGREELRFCLRAVGVRPKKLIDIQMGAGFISCDYPSGYAALLSKLLNLKLSKGETRTDWSKRPLSKQQLEYALNDVIYLKQMRDIIYQKLEKMNRLLWLETELDEWQKNIEQENHERWRRVSGTARLDKRGLAVVRELWQWRDSEAQRRDTPVKRVLRDDLIVELAKRRTADAKKMADIRGLNRQDLRSSLNELAQAVQRALDLPADQCPKHIRRETPPQITLLGQFLASALNSICQSAQVAIGLVGTVQDVRDLVAYRLGYPLSDSSKVPSLATGWRVEVVGQKIDDLLAGKTYIRIEDPTSDKPLVFEPLDQLKKND